MAFVCMSAFPPPSSPRGFPVVAPICALESMHGLSRYGGSGTLIQANSEPHCGLRPQLQEGRRGFGGVGDGCVVRLGPSLEPEGGVKTPSLPCFLTCPLPLSPSLPCVSPSLCLLGASPSSVPFGTALAPLPVLSADTLGPEHVSPFREGALLGQDQLSLPSSLHVAGCQCCTGPAGAPSSPGHVGWGQREGRATCSRGAQGLGRPGWLRCGRSMGAPGLHKQCGPGAEGTAGVWGGLRRQKLGAAC